MDIEAYIRLANELILSQTGKPLNDLQSAVLRGTLQRQTYCKIAESFPCNESHAKDVGSFLWKQISDALGVKVGKDNVRSVLEQYLHTKEKTVEDLSKPNVNQIDNSEITDRFLKNPVINDTNNSIKEDSNLNNIFTHDRDDKCVWEYNRNFVGRDSAIAHLDNLINKGAKVILIQGLGGIGKTTLAQKYLEHKFKIVLEFPIAKEAKDIASLECLLEEKLRQLGEEPGRQLIVSLDRLKRKLQTQEIGILIDNLEPALDASGKFIEQHHSYIQLLRILTDYSTKSITFITSRERLHEGLDIILYKLPNLNIEAWREYWHYQTINPDTSILAEIHKAYGGNALAMKVLCNSITNDFNRDIVAYWRENKTEDNLEVETAVANLIKEQFERLYHIDIDAYNLLCRMGCYRYQDEYVSTIPEEGLSCLLWDVLKNQHKKIVKVLKDRALIDFNNDEFWLHSVIRKEAIERLRNSEYWKQANTQAAEFWRSGVKTIETKKDANRAFEAYHHYVCINNFEQAAYVIIERRESQWGYDENLGRSFYRLGLLKPIKSAINLIKKNITSEYLLANIYNIAGVVYRLLGSIDTAISYHNKSLEITNNFSDDLENNQIDINYHEIELSMFKAILNLGICYLDLWQLEEAINNFEKLQAYLKSVETENQNSYLSSYKVYVLFYLALSYSCFDQKDKSLLLAEIAYVDLDNTPFTSWSRGYSFLVLGLTYKNLEKIEKSFEMYNKAIEYARESQYTQVEGKAFIGLAELYRIQDNFEEALFNHCKSIELLDEIGTKCDLAEAYLQRGLTYQKMSQFENSQIDFNKAIELFDEMKAPKQVEKVKKVRIQV